MRHVRARLSSGFNRGTKLCYAGSSSGDLYYFDALYVWKPGTPLPPKGENKPTYSWIMKLVPAGSSQK